MAGRQEATSFDSLKESAEIELKFDAEQVTLYINDSKVVWIDFHDPSQSHHRTSWTCVPDPDKCYLHHSNKEISTQLRELKQKLDTVSDERRLISMNGPLVFVFGHDTYDDAILMAHDYAEMARRTFLLFLQEIDDKVKKLKMKIGVPKKDVTQESGEDSSATMCKSKDKYSSCGTGPQRAHECTEGRVTGQAGGRAEKSFVAGQVHADSINHGDTFFRNNEHKSHYITNWNFSLFSNINVSEVTEDSWQHLGRKLKESCICELIKVFRGSLIFSFAHPTRDDALDMTIKYKEVKHIILQFLRDLDPDIDDISIKVELLEMPGLKESREQPKHTSGIMEDSQRQTDSDTEIGGCTPPKWKHNDGDTSSDMEDAKNDDVYEGSVDESSDGTDEEEWEGIQDMSQLGAGAVAVKFQTVHQQPYQLVGEDTTSLAQHILGHCQQPQGTTPQQQQQLQTAADGDERTTRAHLSASTVCVAPETRSLQIPGSIVPTPVSSSSTGVVPKTASLQGLGISTQVSASTSTTSVVPETTNIQVTETTAITPSLQVLGTPALTPESTSSVLPRIPGSLVSQIKSSGLPDVPMAGNSPAATLCTIKIDQHFGDLIVKGGKNLNIGGTKNVGTTPTNQEEEEKPLTAAQKIRSIMEDSQRQTDSDTEIGGCTPPKWKHNDGNTSSDMEDAKNDDVYEGSVDESSDVTEEEEWEGIQDMSQLGAGAVAVNFQTVHQQSYQEVGEDTTSLAQHILGHCQQPQGTTPQQQQQLQTAADGDERTTQAHLSASTVCVAPETRSLQIPGSIVPTPVSSSSTGVVPKTASLQGLGISTQVSASTSTTSVVPETTSIQVTETTAMTPSLQVLGTAALTPESTSLFLPTIPGSLVSQIQSLGLPDVPMTGDSPAATVNNLIKIDQDFGDVTVKGGRYLNIGGTKNVFTTPTNQEEEEKALNAAQKIRKRTTSRIQSWTKDMVETYALMKVNSKLDRGATWVTIKGRPGVGKSTTAYMALKDLHSEGRQVYQVVSPQEFNEVIMACSNPVILLDDIFGDLEFDAAEWTKWRPSLRRIVNVKDLDTYTEKDSFDILSKEKIIIILVGRDYVLKSSLADLGRMADYISSPQYEVEVSSQRDSYERRKIWRVHAEAKNIYFEESLVSQICWADCPHGFPHVCKMFVAAYEKDWTHEQILKFFKAPMDFLRKTLDKFLKDKKRRSLFMAMIQRDGKINREEMEEDESLGYECIEAADDLVGSYLKREDDTYRFDHPSIYDCVSFILITKQSVFVIENCSLSFIYQRLRLTPSRERGQNVTDESDLVVYIPWTYARHLARRFASEIKRSNLLHVLSHQAFGNSDFVDLVMDSLKTQFQMCVSDIVKLTDNFSKESFCELLSSNKSHLLIKYIMETENISFTQSERRDILLGVFMNAACSVLEYIIGNMKLDINARYGRKKKTPLMMATETRDSIFVNQIMSLKPDLNATDFLGRNVLYYLYKNGLTSAVKHVIDMGVEVNQDLKHVLYLAIEHGHLEVVKLLVNRGLDMDKQKGLKCAIESLNATMVLYVLDRGAVVDGSALYRACKVGNRNIVEILFEKGATVNMVSSVLDTPLLMECCENPTIASYLLTKGAGVNVHDNTGDTPLHIAAGRRSTECVDVFLKAGADVNVQNDTGDTALHTAAEWWGSTECVDVLLKAGADVNVQNDTGDTALHAAAWWWGSTESVDVLLKAGADVNVQNDTGDTALHTAAERGSTESVDVLLKAGADGNVQNDTGDTALHRAAEWGSTECVDVLLKAGADGNVQNDTGDTALHTAAEWGSTECVDVLLKAGADGNVQNDTGDTALHTAAERGSTECVDVLLKAGADGNVQNKTGDTALHTAAARWGSTKCVDVLLKAGADGNVQNKTGDTALHTAAARWGSTECVDVLLKAGADGNVQNDTGDTALHRAAEWGSTESVDVLLKAGADVNVQNKTGDTALHTAAWWWGSTECVDVLLKAGADGNVQNDTGDTALHRAAGQGSTECVDVLLKAGADVNVQNKTGDTALHTAAARWGSTKCVDVLLKAGADGNVQNDTGDTALHRAIERGSTECVDVLLKAGADGNVQNDTGDTALHRATGQGSTECVDVLLKAGADVNVQNKTGDTPLYTAAGCSGSTECVDVLLKAGADVNVQNNTGDTALHRATGQESTECVDVLLKAGADVNVQNKTGDTPLDRAAGWRSTECVDVLLKAGADVNVQNNTGDTALHRATGQESTECVDVLLKAGADGNVQNDTALHTAAERGSTECVDVLLKAGADGNVQNDTGDTALHRAAGQGSTECVDVLLKAGADGNVQNDTGDTALHRAAGQGSTECVDVLLKAGADVNVQNNTGDTALHTAAGLWESTECVDVLLKAGADVNVQNKTGDTPLHTAALWWGSTECVDVLLKAGADVNVQNDTGHTALHTAAERGSTECVDVLLKAGADGNVQNDTGDTALHRETGQGSTECVDVCLKAGADVNVQNDTGDTALHRATGQGSTECVDVCLKAGADVNVQNKKGDRPVCIMNI